MDVLHSPLPCPWHHQKAGRACRAGNTFGKAIAGILAHSKGRSIGIYEDKERDEEAESKKAKEEEESGVKKVDVFGMKVGLQLSATQQFPEAAV